MTPGNLIVWATALRTVWELDVVPLLNSGLTFAVVVCGSVFFGFLIGVYIVAGDKR